MRLIYWFCKEYFWGWRSSRYHEESPSLGVFSAELEIPPFLDLWRKQAAPHALDDRRCDGFSCQGGLPRRLRSYSRFLSAVSYFLIGLLIISGPQSKRK